jgi:carbon-monoxide dehydrogenase large subunit
LTTYASITADVLGIQTDEIEVIDGDTDTVPPGHGTGGSRAVPIGGSAIVDAAEDVIRKGRQIAANELEARVEDIEFRDGTFAVTGARHRSLTLSEVAKAAAAGWGPDETSESLEATAFYDPSTYTFPFGTHAAVVEVDPATGEVDLLEYAAVTDVGNQIHPQLVDGQVHGGIVQGIGQALYGEAAYDDTGNLQSASFQDYALPKAMHVPDLSTASTVTPCPHNPLGAKGVGESGAIAAPPAVVNAVRDALAPLGVDRLEMPLTPERVWRAIN